MLIGVPKELKNNEYRVGLVPTSVNELTKNGHEVLIEKGLGVEIGISDDEYIKAGASIVGDPRDIYKRAEMIVKVKELESVEYDLIRENQILFTYLHLASNMSLTKAILKSKAIAIAYETVTGPFGLPLLAPMSEVAGKLSVQLGSNYLLKNNGGSGLLVGGITGVAPINILILGAGVVGRNALAISVGLGANIIIIDKSLDTLRELDTIYRNKIKTLYSNEQNIRESIRDADLVISSVLIPGFKAPKLIKKDMLSSMKKGSVIVDVAIDQGGTTETSRLTSHKEPTYVESGIIHYCVPNIPGIVARTASFGLNNATLPFILELANKNYERAFQDNQHLLNGLNIYKGTITNKGVAQSLGLEHKAFAN